MRKCTCINQEKKPVNHLMCQRKPALCIKLCIVALYVCTNNIRLRSPITTWLLPWKWCWIETALQLGGGGELVPRYHNIVLLYFKYKLQATLLRIFKVLFQSLLWLLEESHQVSKVASWREIVYTSKNQQQSTQLFISRWRCFKIMLIPMWASWDATAISLPTVSSQYPCEVG